MPEGLFPFSSPVGVGILEPLAVAFDGPGTCTVRTSMIQRPTAHIDQDTHLHHTYTNV